ncbi:MAG: hypothetical protein ACR2HH_09955 [Chthoniobacterales bacterium]
MSPLLVRRICFTGGLLVLSVITIFGWWLLLAALRPAAIYSGLLLFAIVLALTFFNARKKLPFLPLIRAAVWLQVHIYAGWFALLVFLLHIQFRFPRGPLELTLALVFSIVMLSGILGLYISREIPPRMARSGEALVYERIPALRLHIQHEVEALVRLAEKETDSSTLGDFYVRYLRNFFVRIPSPLTALAAADRSLHEPLAEFNALDRYLNEREKTIANEIRDWMETKQNLDFQYAAQRLLKLWLFVHIPFTYSLLVLGFAHGIIATLYAGRW